MLIFSTWGYGVSGSSQVMNWCNVKNGESVAGQATPTLGADASAAGAGAVALR